MSLKSIRKPVLAVVAAGALAAGGIFAGRLVAGPLSHRGHFAFATAFDHISRRLDLSDSQRSQIVAILREHESEIVAQLQSQRDARRAVHAEIRSASLDEGRIREKAQHLGQVEGDGAILLARIRAEIWPILDEDQKAKITDFWDTRHGVGGTAGDRLISSFREFLASER